MKEKFLHDDTMVVMAALHPFIEALDVAAAKIADWARAKNLLHEDLPGDWHVAASEQRWALTLNHEPVIAGDWVDGKAHADNHTFSGWRNGLALEIAQFARDLTDDAWLTKMDALDNST